MNKFKVAAIQMPISIDKMKNIDTVKQYLDKLKNQSIDFIVLPEMFCCPYKTENFPIYAEMENEGIYNYISQYAKEYNVYIIAGSMPEKDENNKIFNTSYVFNKNGEKIAKHRKAHLFDINIKGGQQFKESDTLSAGDSYTTFDTEFGKMGVCICYDIRFPEMIRSMAIDGAKMVFVPAAFNMTTGPAHWEISFRTRALDNQIYMLGCAPMRDSSLGYTSFGHSILTNPWGKIENMLDEKEGVLIADIDFDYEEQIREQLPLLKHIRYNIYKKGI